MKIFLKEVVIQFDEPMEVNELESVLNKKSVKTVVSKTIQDAQDTNPHVISFTSIAKKQGVPIYTVHDKVIRQADKKTLLIKGRRYMHVEDYQKLPADFFTVNKKMVNGRS